MCVEGGEPRGLLLSYISLRGKGAVSGRWRHVHLRGECQVLRDIMYTFNVVYHLYVYYCSAVESMPRLFQYSRRAFVR